MSWGGRETLWERIVSAGPAVSAEFIKTFNGAMECVIWGKPLVSIPRAAERERVCEPGRAGLSAQAVKCLGVLLL